jgi:hypothetical protein
MEINGYKYSTEQDAIDARKLCNTYYGIPKSLNDITQNWIDYKIAELNNPIFWYIIYDESLNVILGNPIKFNIIIDNPII